MMQDELTEALKGKRVAIIGDVMLDRYIVGSVSRMSPEAPVPVLLHEDSTARLGGAANVALNIKELGSTPYICGFTGEDEAGNELLSQIKSLGCTTDYMVQLPGRKTTVKTRLLGNNQHLLRLDYESSGQISFSMRTLMKERIRQLLEEELDIVILQDYNKGLLSEDVIAFTLRLCAEKGIFVAVDPKFDNFFSYRGVHLFKPNLKEIGQALGRAVQSEFTSLQQATDELNRHISAGYVMITLSDQGIYLAAANSPGKIMPTETSEVIDVCGAGDAVLAVSALMLQSGLGVEHVGHVANKAGKIVCQKIGVAPVLLTELIEDA